MNQPKLVIISNHCVSQTDANGRSLLNMLGEFQPDQLYQIYSANDDTSAAHCCEYLQLTNKNAVRGVLGFGTEVDYVSKHIAPSGGVSAGSLKNATTMLLRDMVWSISWGMKRVIEAWVDRIHPDAVVLQLGDSSNLIHVALTVAKHCKIPIITYNTEDYYFKKYDYMKGTQESNLVFNVFQSSFRCAVKKLFKKHTTVICNCEGLKDLFDKEFGLQCGVIYTASDVKHTENAAQRQSGYISYCGNLGVGRHKSLIEIGEALIKFDPSLHLDVYGNAPSAQIKNELQASKGIKYHGLVPYQKVQEIIANSRLLIHAEGNDPYVAMDTRYAFSTKLADYCCSGIPTLIYAPETGEGMAYAKRNGIAFVASNSAELEAVLKDALINVEMRKTVVDNATVVAAQNHDAKKNGIHMENVILATIKK